MRYFVIFLILIGFFSSANAIQYQSSETDKPVNSENSIHVIPEILWDIHEVILDGTIVEYDNNTWTYHIKINHVFKGSLNFDLISAEGFDVWNYFEKGDSALFYLYDISPVSANYKYKITDYSVKTSPVCDARSLIQISPILPNDPNRIVRGHPNIPADWKDPCVPDYFSYDPDFFNFREVITPLKQLKHKIPIDKIRCYDDKVLLFRNSNGFPACVKPESIPKLIERGWIDSVEYYNNQCKDSPWNCSQQIPDPADNTSKQNDSTKQEILTQLRKGPQNVNGTAQEFIVSEALSDKRVWDLLKDTKYQINCCTYVLDGNEYPYPLYVGVTFQINEKDMYVTAGYDLQQEKITSVEITEGIRTSGVVPFEQKQSETPESLLAQFEILANENLILQDQRILKMQELDDARANKSNSISTLEAELDVINEKIKQSEAKLDQIRTATSKFYEIDSQLKATLEKARQILTDNHDIIPWNGLGIDPKSKTLLIEFESNDLADKYAPVIRELIGEDIPITIFIGKNTFD